VELPRRDRRDPPSTSRQVLASKEPRSFRQKAVMGPSTAGQDEWNPNRIVRQVRTVKGAGQEHGMTRCYLIRYAHYRLSPAGPHC
jgi:hypothetical protein